MVPESDARSVLVGLCRKRYSDVFGGRCRKVMPGVCLEEGAGQRFSECLEDGAEK